MLKNGEKVIYESNNNFELGTFGKLPIGDRKLSITNLGNIIIEENSNFFKREEKKYFYNYSYHKQKFKVILEGMTFILQNESVPFDLITSSGSEINNNKLVIKLSFEDFKNICENQEDFMADFHGNNGIYKIDENQLILGKVEKIDNKLVLSRNEESESNNNEDNPVEINLNDVEFCKINSKNITLKGYFYNKEKDEIIKDIYIYTNSPIAQGLEERVNANRKIGKLPEGSNIFYGNICGTIGDVDYKYNEVFVVNHNDNLIFINKERKNKIITVDVTNGFKLFLDEDVVLYDNENLFTLITSSKNRSEIDLTRLQDINSENIGFTTNNMPFFMKHDEENFSIYKSKTKKLIAIRNNQIKDIIINNEAKRLHDDFSLIQIRFALNSNYTSQISVNLRHDIIPKIMKNTFVYSKSSMILKSPIPMMYMNWAKSVNDMILFNFFGNLYYMKEEIDKVFSEEMTDEDRVKIVNMLYYQIQSQKEQFDIISAYMPKAIEYGEVELFNKYNVKIDRKVFRLLQKQLFGLSNQINRHLGEIERCLSQLSFVIYSEFNTREFNTKLRNRQAGIGMAVSVASTIVMGGALSVPFLAMQGMNLYSNKKMDEKSKEIESSKLRLFTNQAIEKLNHLIDNMYPYYVNEANDNLFELFQVLGKQYANHTNNEVKEILFDRIADIYVCKQMTLNNITNIRKRDIIDKIYGAIDSNINKYDANMFLIGGIS